LTREGCPRHCRKGLVERFLGFYLPVLLPEVDRVLWVDANGIVLDDAHRLVSGLFAGRHSNRSVAAVLGPRQTLGRMSGLSSSALQAAGLDGARSRKPTIAAGLMALNLRQWRASGLTARIEAVIPRLELSSLFASSSASSTTEQRTAAQQSLIPLALVLLNSLPIDVEPLPAHWNVDGLGFARNIPKLEVCDGSFLHWAGPLKPWLGNGRTRMYNEFWQPWGRRVRGAQAAQGVCSPWTRLLIDDTRHLRSTDRMPYDGPTCADRMWMTPRRDRKALMFLYRSIATVGIH